MMDEANVLQNIWVHDLTDQPAIFSTGQEVKIMKANISSYTL